MNNIINLSYIYEYANALNNDRENLKIYIQRLEAVLNTESVNHNESVSNIRKLLDDIDYEITELYRLLMVEIIPGYEELSSSIKKHFNIEFQDDISNLLNIIKED